MAAEDIDGRLDRIEAMLEGLLGGETNRSREWILDAEEFESEDAFRNAVAAEMAAAEHLGHRTGRGIVATPIRVRVARALDGHEEFVTRGWMFREVFVPAARTAPTMTAVPDPVVDPELLEQEELAPLDPVA